ncbi:hypothetical protein J2W55_004964 [Mucilaginibacter pocheonensis]|uniref:Uncharacterized protein n=1 Tax=Mucilaginibacter pocheonensis TaxID=398050 RepID=A0ABU1TI64_9SPHI|nr:hypothetical protein [Mucilaginibacter pocheonensis]
MVFKYDEVVLFNAKILVKNRGFLQSGIFKFNDLP